MNPYPLFILLLLNGCVLLPEGGTRATLREMPVSAHSLTSDPQADQIVNAWPRAEWWRAFHNAELDRLIDAALRDSPSLRVAEARLTQAEAAADFQAAEMLPIVHASVDLHHRHFSETDFYGPNGGKSFTGAYIDPVVFRYHLDLWGKDKAALETALGREMAQASELAMAKLMLSTTIARSYIRLCMAEGDLFLTHALAEKAEQLLALAQLRWQRGLGSKDAVHLAEQGLQAVRQQETGFRHQIQRLRNRLSTLSGQGPDWGLAIKISDLHLVGLLPEPEQIALGLLAHRPDLAAAIWRTKAASKMIKIAETNFYPDINLVGFAGLRSLNLKDLFLSNGASLAYSMGPTVTLPIFEGGRLDAELKNQQAAYDAAVESYNETLLNAVQQVADGLAEWRQTLEHDRAQESALLAAEAESLLAKKRFQAGLSSRDATIESEATLLRQKLAASTMHGAHLLAAVGLIEALGGGYQDTSLNIANQGQQP